MSPFQCACPGCHATLRFPGDLPPGKTVRCPKCEKLFIPRKPAGPETRGPEPRIPNCEPIR